MRQRGKVTGRLWISIAASFLLIIFVNQGFAVYSQKPHNKGLLYLLMTNYGMFGYENQGIWPKGTNEHYIFGAGVWVGGLNKSYPDTTSLTADCDSLAQEIFVNSTSGFDSTGVILVNDELMLYHGKTDTSFTNSIRGFAKTPATLHTAGVKVMKMAIKVSVGYDASSAQTEFVPGDLPNEPLYTNPDERVLMTDDPSDTNLWPLRDSLGNPIIRSKQDSYAIFNDQDSTRCQNPLLIKVIQVGYAWDYHYYEDFIFLNYLVINDSPDTIFHTHLSVNCDADIGDYSDDLIGFDGPRDLGYAFDSDFFEPGWIHTPGFIGFDFLESPPDTLGQQIGLTAFKITHNPGLPGQGEPDPGNDLEAYQLLAGYNYTTGVYHPFDTITSPTDVRFLQCTGPFNFAPGETVKIVIAVIAGADTNDFLANDDLAQNLYNSNYLTHRITVQSPNGGEEISGVYTITWTDSSSTGAPLLVDISCSRDGGKTFQDIVTSIPDNQFYDWNTVGFPDGKRYVVRVTVHDTIAVGEDFSDSLFTINNPGNGVPDVILLGPLSGTLKDTVKIKWWADDADHDTLEIDLYAKREGFNWEAIAESLSNTGEYTWNTFYFHNGNYQLKVVARDNDTLAVDSSLIWLTIVNDHPSAATVEHIQGGCNSLCINCLLYHPEQITGHTYEIRFKPIQKATLPYDVYYSYSLRDITLDTLLISNCSLAVYLDGRLCIEYSSITDGFALEFNTQIDKNSFRFIDFDIIQNLSGFDGNLEIFGEDSMGTAPPSASFAWAFRGSDYIIRWKKYAPDTTKLTLEITDTTNLTLIPYGNPKGDNWQFGPTIPSETFNPAVHKAFYLCGNLFWFNKNGEMTIPPDAGDVWKILSSGHRVPCNENIYRFTTTGVGEMSNLSLKPRFAVFPSIFTKTTTINFTISNESRINISVYNIIGQKVSTIINSTLAPGHYQIPFNARAFPAGIYFIMIEGNDIKEAKKIIHLK